MKVAALAYLFTGLCVLTPAVFGLLTGHVGIYLLVYGTAAAAYFVVAWELNRSRAPVRVYFILMSLFMVGASGYMLFLTVPLLADSLRLGVEPGIFLWTVGISAAVGLAQAVAAITLLRARRTSMVRPA